MSIVLCDLLYDLVNPVAQRRDREGGASWDVHLRADNVEGWMCMPPIALAVQDDSAEDGYDRLELSLATADARKLACS